MPGEGDDVCIDRPAGDFTITFSTGSTSINSLHSQEALVVSGGTLTVAAGSEIENNLTLSGGTLTGGGDIVISGTFNWSGGTLSGSGILNPDGGMLLSGTSSRTINGRTLNINADATWTGGNITMNDGAVINVAQGALFDAQGDNTVQRASSPTGAVPVFNNAGTFRKSAGIGTTTFSNVNFNNSNNTVEVHSGTLRLDGGGTSSGSFVVDAGATLEFQGHALEAGSSVTGAGTVRFTGSADISVRGVYNITGVTELSGFLNTVNFHPEATVFSVGSRLSVISPTTANFSSGEAISVETLNITSGTLAGSAPVTVTGGGTWDRFTIAGAGGVTVVNGARVIIAQSGTLTGRLVNHGTVAWVRAPGVGGTLSLSGEGELVNEADGVLQGDAQGNISIGVTLTNLGTLIVPTGRSMEVTGVFTNFSGGTLDGGTYDVAGTFRFTNAAIATNAASIMLDGPAAAIINTSNVNALANILAINEGSLTLTNGRGLTVPGGFSNRGALTLGPGSTLVIEGDFAQTADGSLIIELGGAPASEQFGRLIADGGAATLQGALDIHLVNGYGPTTGHSFQFASYLSHTGEFDTVTRLNLGRVLLFELVVDLFQARLNALADATDLEVQSITVPSSGRVGEEVSITYTVQNETTTPALGDWFDSLYLSVDSLLGPDDALIGRVQHTGGLESLATYTETLTAPVPPGLDGNYRVIVVADSRGLVPDKDRPNNQLGSFSVISVEMAVLRLGESVSGTIGPGQEFHFRLDVPSATDARLRLDPLQVHQAEMFVSFGAVPTRGSFDFCACVNRRSLRPEVLLSGAAGRYFILLRGRELPQGGSPFTLTSEAVQFEVRQVSPDFGSHVGQATATVTGSGFSPSTIVTLVAEDGTERQAGRVLFRGNNTLFATFDLTGLATGFYDVRADDGAATATLSRAFLVTDGPPGQLTFDLITPRRVAAARPEGPTIITYANTGQTDIPAPVLRLGTDNDAHYQQTQRPLSSLALPSPGGGSAGFLSSSIELAARTPRPAPELQFLGVNRDGAAGVLPPGYTGRIVVGFGTRRNAPVPPPLRFELSLLDSPTEPFDWNEVKDEARPETIPPDAWEALFANWVARVGGNLAGYEAALDAAATHLSQIGQTTDDVELLLAFIFNQLDNAYPGGPLALGMDAVAPAPGLPPMLLRMYLQPITDRYHLGIFGRGWTHPYEATVQMIDAIPPFFPGRIAILGPKGTRFFEQVKEKPDSDGATLWQGIHGDPGVLLAKLSGSALMRAVLFEPDGTAFHFEEEDEGKLSFIEDLNRNQITLEYTEGRLTGIIHSNGDRLTLEYNAHGRVGRLIDQAGRATIYTYDDAGEHLMQVAGPLGVTEYTYESGSGLPREHAIRSITFPDGSHILYDYDALGRLVRIERDGGAEAVTLDYGTEATVTFTESDDASTTVLYNLFGKVGQVRDPLGRIVQREYDANQNLALERLPGNVSSVYRFTLQDFLSRLVTPNGNVIRQFTGPVSSTTRRESPPSSEELTPLQTGFRISAVDNELGVETTFRYTGLATALRTGINQGLGNLAKTFYTDQTSEEFAYDSLGNLVQMTNRRDQSIHYTYDARGQVLRKDHADGSHEEFTYDERGNLLTATGAEGTTSFEYDGANRILRVTYPNGRFLSYTYDTGGRRASMEDQDGFRINYNYDDVGRLESVTDKLGNTIVAYTYDAVGRIEREDKGNGTFTTYEYDPAGQLVRLTNHAANGSVNSQFEYTYDNLGQRTSMTTPEGTTTYGYDAIGQLTSVLLPDGRAIQYEYDAAGNRLSVTDGGVVTEYQVNDMNQYTSIGPAQRTYDPDGNLISQMVDGATTRYEYDDENRLVKVVTPTDTWVYEYDALGMRVAVVHNSVRTEYLNDLAGWLNVVGEYDGNGNLIASYARALGLVSRVDATGTFFYDFDAVGSTTGLTGADGSYVNRYSYLPFGEPLTVSEAFANPFTYIGQFGVMRESNGLDFMRARYYSPVEGRFITEDPIRLVGGLNLYRYVSNNPVTWIDPFGLIGLPRPH